MLQLDSAGVWIKMDMSLRELEQEESLTALPLVRIVKMSDPILISWFCLSLSMPGVYVAQTISQGFANKAPSL